MTVGATKHDSVLTANDSGNDHTCMYSAFNKQHKPRTSSILLCSMARSWGQWPHTATVSAENSLFVICGVADMQQPWAAARLQHEQWTAVLAERILHTREGMPHLGTAQSMNSTNSAICVLRAARRKSYVRTPRTSNRTSSKVLQHAPKMTQNSRCAPLSANFTNCR